MDNKEHRFFTLSVDDVARLLDKTPASLRQGAARYEATRNNALREVAQKMEAEKQNPRATA